MYKHPLGEVRSPDVERQAHTIGLENRQVECSKLKPAGNYRRLREGCPQDISLVRYQIYFWRWFVARLAISSDLSLIGSGSGPWDRAEPFGVDLVDLARLVQGDNGVIHGFLLKSGSPLRTMQA